MSDLRPGTGDSLLTAAAVRERSTALFEHGLAGRLRYFTVDLGRLPAAADEVAATVRAAYPDPRTIPFHARWRHFSAGGVDRWAALADAAAWPDPSARGRAAFDLAIVSVLTDAGAGPGWAFREGRTGQVHDRSEGLAVAGFEMFVSGAFSGRPQDPFRVDAEALSALTPEELAEGFQAGPDNPLIGVEGRARLLNRLGARVAERSDLFARADDPRPGGLFDALADKAVLPDAPPGRSATARALAPAAPSAESGPGFARSATRDDERRDIPAPAILALLLDALGPIWPERIRLHGVDLGDAWRHPLVETGDATSGIVPFHKLSQWLAYSLIEPLEEAGFRVTDVGGLTGLPEYRNGGLFLDTGVIVLRDPVDAERPHEVGSELVVEWRALTVALLDRIAPLVRERLRVTETELPLAKVLEGGTWATGRRLAAERREGGAPPLRVLSDGTVF